MQSSLLNCLLFDIALRDREPEIHNEIVLRKCGVHHIATDSGRLQLPRSCLLEQDRVHGLLVHEFCLADETLRLKLVSCAKHRQLCPCKSRDNYQ